MSFLGQQKQRETQHFDCCRELVRLLPFKPSSASELSMLDSCPHYDPFRCSIRKYFNMASQIQGLSMFIDRPDARCSYTKGRLVSPPSRSRCHFTVRRVHVMTILAIATSITPSAPVI